MRLSLLACLLQVNHVYLCTYSSSANEIHIWDALFPPSCRPARKKREVLYQIPYLNLSTPLINIFTSQFFDISNFSISQFLNPSVSQSLNLFITPIFPKKKTNKRDISFLSYLLFVIRYSSLFSYNCHFWFFNLHSSCIVIIHHPFQAFIPHIIYQLINQITQSEQQPSS